MAAGPRVAKCLVSGIRQLSSRLTFQSCPGLASHHFSKISSVRSCGGALAARGYSSEIGHDYKFTKSHEWVKLDDGYATVGISDYAQDKLGELVYVEVPEVGTVVERDKQFTVLESVKAVADVNAPFNGTITEVNDELESSPNLINEEPYEKGWIAKLEVSDMNELNELMTLDEYNQHISEDH